jgi:hypothetical protein
MRISIALLVTLCNQLVRIKKSELLMHIWPHLAKFKKRSHSRVAGCWRIPRTSDRQGQKNAARYSEPPGCQSATSANLGGARPPFSTGLPRNKVLLAENFQAAPWRRPQPIVLSEMRGTLNLTPEGHPTRQDSMRPCAVSKRAGACRNLSNQCISATPC